MSNCTLRLSVCGAMFLALVLMKSGVAAELSVADVLELPSARQTVQPEHQAVTRVRARFESAKSWSLNAAAKIAHFSVKDFGVGRFELTQNKMLSIVVTNGKNGVNIEIKSRVSVDGNIQLGRAESMQ